jgi:hypothetical protein
MVIIPENRLPEDTVIAACEAIYLRWRRFLPHTEALEQAAQFAARYETLAEVARAVADREQMEVPA